MEQRQYAGPSTLAKSADVRDYIFTSTSALDCVVHIHVERNGPLYTHDVVSANMKMQVPNSAAMMKIKVTKRRQKRHRRQQDQECHGRTHESGRASAQPVPQTWCPTELWG